MARRDFPRDDLIPEERLSRRPQARQRPRGYDDQYWSSRAPEDRVGFSYNDRDPRLEGDDYAYQNESAPGNIDPDIAFGRGPSAERWGGHLGAQDRFGSGLTDRYGYGRGDFQDQDLYGRREYYRQGPLDESYRPHEREHQPVPQAYREHAQPTPDHRGRGPKGYQRSDERILEEVCERLSDDPAIDASDIEVHCEQGIVTLEGTIESRTKKHHVESLVADVRGVKDIVNDLTIATGWPGGASGLGRQGSDFG